MPFIVSAVGSAKLPLSTNVTQSEVPGQSSTLIVLSLWALIIILWPVGAVLMHCDNQDFCFTGSTVSSAAG